jgi:hypothetical protein
MPGEHTAERLNEKTHLFLSSRKSHDPSAENGAEAVLWLVVTDRRCNRGLIAAGVAEAVAGLGVRCTLAEIGTGLPNAGYYFALEPSEYLAPTLDASRVITGGNDTRIRFFYAVEPDRLAPSRIRPAETDAPHVIISAFRHGTGADGDLPPSAAASVSGRFSSRGAEGGGRSPDGVVFFTGVPVHGRGRAALASLRDAYPSAALFAALRGEPGRSTVDGVETLSYPHRLLREWGKRSPPVDPFFSDLATRCLQIFSHRRRKGGGHAAG